MTWSMACIEKLKVMNSQMDVTQPVKSKNVEKDVEKTGKHQFRVANNYFYPQHSSSDFKGVVKRNSLGEIHKEDYLP